MNAELEFLMSLWGLRNRGGIGLSYRPARLHRLAEFIPLESVPGLHKRLKIRALYDWTLAADFLPSVPRKALLAND